MSTRRQRNIINDDINNDIIEDRYKRLIYKKLVIAYVCEKVGYKISQVDADSVVSYIRDVNKRQFNSLSDDDAAKLMADDCVKKFTNNVQTIGNSGRTIIQNDVVDLESIYRQALHDPDFDNDIKIGQRDRSRKKREFDDNIVQSTVTGTGSGIPSPQDSSSNAQSTALASNININAVAGISSKYGILRGLNPESLYQTEYVELDSKYRQLDILSTQGSVFTWKLPNVTNNNGPSISENVRDIISIKIGKIRIKTAAQNSFSQYHNEILLGFANLFPQAYKASQGRTYHFVMERSIDPQINNPGLLDLTPRNDGLFKFNPKLRQLNELQLVMYDPFVQLQFALDYVRGGFTYGNPTIITTDVNHGLNTGDYISMDDFTTLAPVNDSGIISTMNRQTGHLVTRISNTQFSIAVDTTTVTPVVSFMCNVLIQKNRFVLHLEITYLPSQLQDF
jgi:hypothetical protein